MRQIEIQQSQQRRLLGMHRYGRDQGKGHGQQAEMIPYNLAAQHSLSNTSRQDLCCKIGHKPVR